MNKHTIITITAIIVIVIPFAVSGLNIIGIQQMEYRWNGPGTFSFFTLSNSGNMEFCNATPFWTSFKKLEVKTFYEAKHIGTFTVKPLTINPFSSTIQDGVFSSEEIVSAQHIFMSMDFEFDGGDIRLDPNNLIVVIHTETPIIGIIPYASNIQISGFDFDKMMNVEDLSCD
ncbi:MAG: thr operon leader peptide [Nitrosopumilus sp.]|nr:thr operon leader peptide [Nitrosopumilus sp.]MDH3489517.1 thr operon leader peptide [Nitrosopumilus sp.]MDH3516515.1 thr operon leader peptide [Nitrosopumilus sp.]MDH3564981.1 thr operon leader peptide [Nitrosopumilus sp.]MDH5416404.1 thr operon leader peptide [Nitrosopumilus sp.]